MAHLNPMVEFDRLNTNFIQLPREISLFADATEIASLRSKAATDRILKKFSKCPIVFAYRQEDLPLILRLRENNWKGWVAVVRSQNPDCGPMRFSLIAEKIPCFEISEDEAFVGHLLDTPGMNPFVIASRHFGTSTGSGPSNQGESSSRVLMASNPATQPPIHPQNAVLDIERHPILVEASRIVQENDTLFQLPRDLSSFAAATETASNLAKAATEKMIKRLSKCPAVFVHTDQDLPLLLRLRGKNWKGWAALIAQLDNASPNPELESIKTILRDNDIPYFVVKNRDEGYLQNSPELNPFVLAKSSVGTSTGSDYTTPAPEDVSPLMLDFDELISSPTTTTHPATHSQDIGDSPLFNIPMSPTFNRFAALSPHALTQAINEAMRIFSTHPNSSLSPYSAPFGESSLNSQSGFNVSDFDSPRAQPGTDTAEIGTSNFIPNVQNFGIPISSEGMTITTTNSVTSTTVISDGNVSVEFRRSSSTTSLGRRQHADAELDDSVPIRGQRTRLN